MDVSARLAHLQLIFVTIALGISETVAILNMESQLQGSVLSARLATVRTVQL